MKKGESRSALALLHASTVEAQGYIDAARQLLATGSLFLLYLAQFSANHRGPP